MPKFLANVDLNRNQLRNAVVHPLASAPSSPVEGQVYEDTTAHKLYYYNGSVWVPADGSSLRLDQIQLPTASVALNNQKITGLGTPTTGTDASTKAYVDNATAGVTSTKGSVKALAVANYVVATGGLTVTDGVTPIDGDRILLTGQTTASENGIWVAHAGAWTRPTDYATGSVQQGAYVFVDGGTVYGNTGWLLTGTSQVTVDTTAETWVQFTGLGDITVVAPIVKTGNQLSLSFTPTKKYATLIGDGSTLAYTVTHNLASLDVVVNLREVSTGNKVEADVVYATTNTITVTFAVAPTTNAISAIVVG